MEYFGKSRNGDYQRHRPSQEYSPDNRERSELQSSRKTTPSSNFENLNGNGDRNSQRTRSIDGTANGSGPRHLPLGGSNVFYGYGGPFRLDDDTDGSSEMDSSLGFKIQPWMDKITGGTFKRNYIDRYSFRPSLHHDSQNRMGDIPQFRSNASSTESYTKGSKSRTIKTILLIFLGIILIGIVAGVIAYFLSKKESGDTTIKYYVASGEISLNEIFYEELSDTSSEEFKNLSSEFCGAITEALKNSTENGDKYRLCEVIDFRNGSIKVRFKVYYVYTATFIITNETVQKDLNNSLTPQNAGLAQLSTLVIIRVSLKITVEVETFQKVNDPAATSLLPSTTPLTTTETTTVPAATTTTSVTTTPTTLPTNETTETTLDDTSTPTTSTTPMNTTTADYSTTPETETAETTEEYDATTEETQLNITITTLTAESTADTKPTPTTESTIPETTESSTENTIAVSTQTESTTENTIPVTTQTESTISVSTQQASTISVITRPESTIPVTTQTESTIPVTTQTESTIPVTTQPESTIPVTTQRESTIPVTTQSKSTIHVTTQTESTIPVTTQTESTIPVTTQPESTIPVTTQTESTIPVTTQSKSSIHVTTQPESTIPVTTQRESTIPVTTQTESTIPVTTVAESTIPVTTQTESTIPVTTQSKSTIYVTTQPESTIPVTTQTESTIPVTTQPESTIPVTTQTESTKPVTTQPESTIPVTTQTESTKPVTTQTESTIPVTTQPESTIPVTTQTESTIPVTTQPESTIHVTTQPESTIPVTTQRESTKPVTTQPESTIPVTTQTESTKPVTTQTESTIPVTTQPESTIPVTTQTESTIPVTTQPESTIHVTTQPESTIPVTTQTESTTQTTMSSTENIKPTTTAVKDMTDMSSTDRTPSTTMATERTTDTKSSAEMTTTTETKNTGTSATTQTIITTTNIISMVPSDSIVDTTLDSTANFTIKSTFETTTAVTVEHTADIRASRITAIVGESTTTQACVIIPDGEWLHVELSIDYNSSSHVIAKLDHNKTFEKPTSLDRFNGSINMDGEDIVVRLTVDLTLPKSDFCTWDGRYFTKCSVIMNDTMQTSKSNGSQISITAPMAKVNINPGVDYTEGDLVTFNCSTNIDPNYSEVSLEINSFVMDQLIMSPIPSERNSDCSVNATWSARSPNPLTTNENGVVIRCIVKNSLLDKSETIEKTLNVSAVDVAFSKYSYSTLTKEVQVIECIARGSSAILQNMTIIRDSVDIVTLDGSGTPMILTSESRYTVTKENDADDVKLILRIKTVDCEDQGTYRCSVLTTKNDSRSSPRMTFNVLGATPTLTLNPDIYERFARPGLNHICRTTHTGDIQSDKYLEIQVYRPNDTSGFRYSKKLPESEKEFNSKDNITYINIAGTTARFLLVSDFSTNNSCNNTQTIVFLLDRAMEFDKGIVKCVLRDDNFEYASAAENITVIPDEYCFGYEDIPKRNHPNNDCHYFVNCAEVGGRMYATGDSCRRPGECMDFSLDYCVDCDENFTCKSPEPVTTTTTLAPGKTYVQCADVSQKEGSPITINCTVLDDTFQSLNVTLTSSSNLNIEEIVGVILPDGTIKNQARSSPVLSTTFSVSSKYIHLIIASSSCMEEGKYLLTDTNVSMDTQPSISDFYFDNLVPVKELTINSESMYKEGKPLMFNCTATVDSDHTKLLGYYKLPADNSFVKVQGEQTILQKFTQNCTKSVISMFDTGLIVSANLNGTKLKCLYNEISPEVSEEKNVKIQSADVAFNTYKLKAELQSKANFTCLVRSTGSYKAIKILKIINSTSMMEMASYTSSSDSVQNIAGVDANFSSNALTLIFASVMCSDEGQYNCTVIMDDDAELQPPLSLDVQVTTSPGFSTVELFVNPDIVENKDSGTHHCLGPVGYPEVGGHLEITFVHPLINYNITLNKNSTRTISGNEIEIKSTLEPFTKEDCKNMEKISFTINSSKNWNKGKIICEVKNGEHKATKDDIFFVIDGSFCNSTNNQEIYFDHEKEDFCNTYIQCSGGKPFGRSCKPNRCVYIGKTYCEDCSTAVCSEGVTTTEVTLSSFETTPVPGPRSLNCTSPSVYEGERATIPCSLNVSSFDFISISNDKGMIMSIFENTTVIYFGDSSSTFQGSLTGKTVIFIVKNLNCNNSLDYVFKLYNGGEVSSSVTANPLMKVKPITPVLNIDYRLEMGKNQNFHTCKGYVGNPKGSLELEIRNGSLATYNKYIPTTQSFDTPVYENCNHYLTLTFSIDLTKDNLTGQHIRCLAKNIESLENTDPIPTSNEVLIIPLPANPCSKGNGDYPHPRDCYHYLQCSNNIAYTQICPGGGCFNDTAKACL